MVTLDGQNNVVHKKHPAVKNMRRISVTRVERLKKLLEMFRAGKSVQQIAEETGYKKDRVYHEMYFLKAHGLLSPDFKNPSSVHIKKLSEVLK